MGVYGKFFKIAHAIVRPFQPKYRYEPKVDLTGEGAVYICRHQDMRGPFVTVLNLPFEVRIWSFYKLVTREECFQHTYHYTFTQRLHWPKWIAKPAAWLFALVSSGMIQSLGAIPVYRGTPRLGETFELSAQALERGENIIIFVDKAYTNRSNQVGEIYTGFFQIDTYYRELTGKPAKFVPLYADAQQRVIQAGTPMTIPDGMPMIEARKQLGEEMREQIGGNIH